MRVETALIPTPETYIQLLKYIKEQLLVKQTQITVFKNTFSIYWVETVVFLCLSFKNAANFTET